MFYHKYKINVLYANQSQKNYKYFILNLYNIELIILIELSITVLLLQVESTL
jgi:hypothetical protein